MHTVTKMVQSLAYLNLSNMKHLEEAGMGYFEHLRFAWSMAIASFVHGIFPMLFTDYVSNKIQQRNETTKGNK